MSGRVERWAFPSLVLGLSALVLASHLTLSALGLIVDRNALESRLEADGQRAASRVEGLLENHARTLMVTANSPVLHQGSHTAIGRHLFMVAQADTRIDQARVLYLDGREEVRVNNGAPPTLVPANELQDKSTRPYFRDTRDTPPGTLRISPLDLNIEHGRVEYPLVPTVRLSTPLFTDSGTRRGVLVFNVDAGLLVDLVGRSTLRVDEDLVFHVTDSHWVLPDPETPVGWVIADGPTASDRFPRLIERTRLADQGLFVDGDRLWYHQVIDLEQGLSGIRLISTVIGHARAHIFIGAPRPTLLSVVRANPLPPLLGLIVAVALAWFWSRALIALARAKDSRSRAYARLAQSERLAGLGGMVAGIAHELNTPIGNALTIATTMKECAQEARDPANPVNGDTLDDDLIDTMVEGGIALEHSLARASTLIRRFKGIAVDQSAERRRAFRTRTFLADLVATLQPRFKHGPVRLELTPVPDMEMDGYPGALGQVVMNLVDNARVHGFPEGHPGTITLSLEESGTDHITLTCTDTGQGVAPDHVNRLFEPFFTTRATLGGGGLGLSITHSLVTNLLGGTITVDSTPNKGTRFTVTLPRISPAEEDQTTASNSRNKTKNQDFREDSHANGPQDRCDA